jgi:hypothetical protein
LLWLSLKNRRLKNDSCEAPDNGPLTCHSSLIRNLFTHMIRYRAKKIRISRLSAKYQICRQCAEFRFCL